MWRYVSNDDGRTFARSPERPVMASWSARAATKAAAGEGRESNDAFDVMRNEDGTYEYYAATVEKAGDPRQVIKHDNAAGWVREIGHATSRNGIDWSAVKVVIEPDFANGDGKPGDASVASSHGLTAAQPGNSSPKDSHSR